MDGVLFPLSFMISNGMHRILLKLIIGKITGEEDEDEQYPKIDEETKNYERNSHEGINIPMSYLSNKKYSDDDE